MFCLSIKMKKAKKGNIETGQEVTRVGEIIKNSKMREEGLDQDLQGTEGTNSKLLWIRKLWMTRRVYYKKLLRENENRQQLQERRIMQRGQRAIKVLWAWQCLWEVQERRRNTEKIHLKGNTYTLIIQLYIRRMNQRSLSLN